jgi:hypothetical protein
MSISPIVTAMLGIGLAMSAASVRAHGDGHLDGQPAPNGGQVRAAGPYHLELVVAKDAKGAAEDPIVVLVTDHGEKKIATAGATAHATLLAGKQKTRVALQPDGDNRFKGLAKYTATPEMKVVVSVAFPGKAPEQARFTPLAGAKSASAHHHH